MMMTASRQLLPLSQRTGSPECGHFREREHIGPGGMDRPYLAGGRGKPLGVTGGVAEYVDHKPSRGGGWSLLYPFRPP
jgi:hypothetical protein